jgi:hypothetical protein
MFFRRRATLSLSQHIIPGLLLLSHFYNRIDAGPGSA